MLGVVLSGIAHLVQLLGVIPSVLQAQQGAAPFFLGLFLLALGTGMLCYIEIIKLRY